jgi:hypothetical protein
MDEKLRKEIFQEYLSNRRRGRIPVEMDFNSFVDMMVDRAMEQLDEDKASKMKNGGLMGLANGGRIGFESGTREGRTVGMSKNRVTQLLDLRQEAVDKKDEDKIIEIDQELSMMGFRTSKALGGRIGFQKGRSVQPLQIPQLGTGDMIKYFRDALEQANPDATDEQLDDAAEKMFRGELALKDSKQGLGSMMAMADDEDEYKSHPFIDDPEGRMETDEFEAIRQIMESGRLTQLDDDELRRMYDSMVESEAGIKLLDEYNINSFDDYKEFISRTRRRPEGIENVMPTMVA